MKNIISLLFLSFLLFSCEQDGATIKLSSTPDEMGKVLYEAIKTQDAATIRAYFATSDDIEEWLYKSDLTEKKKEKKRNKFESKMEALNDGIAKRLALIHKEPIDWKNTQFDWIDYKNFEKDKVTGADIIIVFSEGNIQYELKLDDCYPTKRGWVLFDEITFKGARK